MRYKYVVKAGLVVMGICAIFVNGCANQAQTGGLIGTAAGAGIGQAIGRNTEGTLIGAAVGGVAGYILGNEGDKAKTESELAALRAQQQAQQAQQQSVTVWITNSNGSKTPVVLKISGPNYIGPKGEVYPSMPTEEQLRPLYGF